MLLEELMRRGAPSLATEIAEGRHFDPVQRLTFLERFEYRDDRRVQGMVRQKAASLRTLVLARMEGEVPEGQTSPSGWQGHAKCEGYGSNGPGLSPVCSADADPPLVNPAYPGFGSESLPPLSTGDSKGTGNKVVNGLVSVGHNDDTTSESDADQGHQVRGRQKGIASSERRRPLEDSTDSSSERSGSRRRRERRRTRPAAHAVAARPKPPPAQEKANLLGGMDPAPAPAPKPQEDDLLGSLLADPPPAKPVAQYKPPEGGVSNLLDL